MHLMQRDRDKIVYTDWFGMAIIVCRMRREIEEDVDRDRERLLGGDLGIGRLVIRHERVKDSIHLLQRLVASDWRSTISSDTET